MPVVIPYWGGKYKLSKVLIPMIPKHKHYIEVFAGGLSMFFHKAKAEWNCVNDISNDLANLYMVIGDEYLFNIFARKVYYAIKSRAYYDQIRQNITKENQFTLPDVERAFNYYYFIRNSFNCRLNTAFNKDITGWTVSMLNTLKFARERLNGVIVENMDFSKLIDKYGHKENAFWYFDPPYTMADTEEYYLWTFSEDQHIQMFKDIEMICATSDAKIMISYDDSEFVKQLYKNFHITEIKTKYSGNRSNPDEEFTELIITNYNHQQQESLNFEDTDDKFGERY